MHYCTQILNNVSINNNTNNSTFMIELDAGTVISSWSDNHSYLYYRYDSDSESDYNQKRIHYFSIDYHMVNSTYQKFCDRFFTI